MVPRTGPFSASSAFWSTSWYQRGKSSARGVSTRLAAMEQRVVSPRYTRPARWYLTRKPDRLVDYGDRRSRVTCSAPRPDDRRGAAHLRRRCPALPRGRDRRRRVSGVPLESGHLRATPGRPQPDGAGEDPVRTGGARPARNARLRRRDVLAWVGSPHHPSERAVALRAARADGRSPATPRVGRPHES